MSTATKVKIKKRKSLKKECDDLLRELCLLRAKNKSELSGKSDILQVHHLVGKPNYFLRYHLENCIVITIGEHFWIAHNPDRIELFRDKIKAIRGQDIYERLEQYRQLNVKTDLTLIKLYLKQEIEKIKNGTIHNKM